MSDPRDAELGTRLDELEVREHGDDYWTAVMAAATPELDRLRVVELEAKPSAFAAFVERHPTFGGGFRWWAAAAVAAAVAVVIVLAGLPGGEQVATVVGPAPATAAEAAGYALNALDRSPGLEGTLIWRVLGVESDAGQYEETTFVADQDGSLRLEKRRQDGQFAPRWVRDTLAYDAQARTLQSLSDQSELVPTPIIGESSAAYPRWWLERSGLAAAEPDRELLDGGFPLWRVRAYLRTMMGDPEARFTTTEEDGRAVWVLSAEAVEADYSSGVGIEPVSQPVTITIDAATRLPLALESAAVPGRVVGQVTTFDLHPLSEAPARDRFTLQRPDDPGTSINDASSGFGGGDQGFRDLPFGDDAAIRELTSGMAAFPQWLPGGFGLSSGTFKDEQSVIDYRRDADAPVTLVHRTIVSLCFRRGFDQAFVSLRVDPRLYSSAVRGNGKDRVRTDTSDPFVRSMQPEVAALWASHTDDVRLAAGGFAGATAHVVAEPDHWPHLWVRKGPYIACVAGDLTKAQMVRIAESLRPWSAPATE
jgi:hypothetical protein